MRYSCLFLMVWLISITGCTRRGLLEEEHAHGNDGYLKINLIWNGHTKPQSTQYYFYDRDGGDPIHREGNTDGFEGYMPAATYDVVICNTALIGVDLNSALGYDADHVQARLLDETGFISHVDHIFGTGVAEVTVLPSEVVEKTANPLSLVKKLTILFRGETRKNIKGMSVHLCGAVRWKRLVDHAMSDETAFVISDAVYDDDTNQFYCSISTLGFRGSCQLHVDVTYDDNEIVSAYPIDLSDELNDFPEEEKTLEYILKLTDGEEIKVTVQIHPWISAGGTQIIIQ